MLKGLQGYEEIRFQKMSEMVMQLEGRQSCVSIGTTFHHHQDITDERGDEIVEQEWEEESPA